MNNFILLAAPDNIQAKENEKKLLLKYRTDGSLSDLGNLYEPYMDLVYGVCLKYLKEPEDAKDAVMNIFEELVTKLKKYEVDNFKGWLHRLASNHCLMKLRANKSGPVNVDPGLMQFEDDAHPAFAMEKETMLNRLEYCIEQLTGLQKKAVQLFYLREKCYKEIADDLAEDVNKVRSYIQNGRRNLKICMETKPLSEA